VNLEISASLVTDVGRARSNNEDYGRIVQPGGETGGTARGTLAIVADGMGGHSGGEVASRLAVETIHREYFATDAEPHAALAAACAAANEAIFDRASNDEALHGMGTTCVALVIRDGLAYAASIGDSRIYLVRAGGIYQMTVDDSAVAELVQKGLISRAEARHHEERNVLLKALGTARGTTVAVWTEPFPMRRGDTFVLCSDGLTDLVEDDEILTIAGDGHTADGCQALVDLAKARGGFDNITVAVLRVTEPAASMAVPATRESVVTS
jgi:serine/threonine protein phosphatase PrpC